MCAYFRRLGALTVNRNTQPNSTTSTVNLCISTSIPVLCVKRLIPFDEY